VILTIPDALDRTLLADARAFLADAPWVDGRVTAGHQSAAAKHNEQVPLGHPAAVALGERILAAVTAHPLLLAGALPLRIFPPLFNRHRVGHEFGTHVDNAVRKAEGNPQRVRTDLSVTVFLSEPEDYDGGELCIEDVHGARSIKLPAAHLVLYPSSTLHGVRPVTRGTRLCAVFWIQSMVRSGARRSILLDLDLAIQRLNADHPEHPSLVPLLGVYHNLVREWAET
jgi:PKHD-type hydroxylase